MRGSYYYYAVYIFIFPLLRLLEQATGNEGILPGRGQGYPRLCRWPGDAVVKQPITIVKQPITIVN